MKHCWTAVLATVVSCNSDNLASTSIEKCANWLAHDDSSPVINFRSSSDLDSFAGTLAMLEQARALSRWFKHTGDLLGSAQSKMTSMPVGAH